MAGASASGGTAIDMLRTMSLKAGTYIREGAVKTADVVSESTKTVRNSKFAESAGQTASIIGVRAAESGTYLYNVTKSTTEGVVGKFSAGALTAECAKEARDTPCPRMMIICCSALCASGLVHEGVFTDAHEEDAGAALYQELKSCNYSRLPDTSATPQVISQALKRWLLELQPEPLLTFKLVPALTSPDTPRESLKVVLTELPPANQTALFMLLEICNRIAGNAAINATDAKTLATALAPCLLWKEAAEVAPATEVTTQREQLTAEDEAVFVRLLTYMISNFRILSG